MNFVSARECAGLWDISQRRVAALCSENRIPGAMMVGNMWIIPENAEKPIDARCNTGNSSKCPRPFLKWAGGKGQLVPEIKKYYPFEEGKITKYAEPFVGGGAVLFDVLSRYELEAVYISDTNKELINTYRVIRSDVEELIERLSIMQEEYLPKEVEERKKYYIDCRSRYNRMGEQKLECDAVEKAALMIFLNRTCFNGLYRVNRRGLFNVPIGSYKNPLICDDENLNMVSKHIQNVNIVCGDYQKSRAFIDVKTFVYFDPPYRPLPNTASFTAYTEGGFDDEEQIRLANYVLELNKLGAKVLVSNSDPKNTDDSDDFFERIYSGVSIYRVQANRMINSKAISRGKISELLIANV